MAAHAIPVLEPLDEVIKETMEDRVDYQAGELSSFWRDLTKTSTNVVQGDWGRDYIIKKTFRKGLAGAFHWGNTIASATTELAPDDTMGGSAINPNTAIWGTIAQQTWPGANDATTVGYFNWQISIAKAYGNIFIPLEVKRAASLNASIADQAAHTIEATAENVAMNCCNAFLAETHVAAGVGGGHDATLDGVVLAELVATTTSLADNESGTYTLKNGSIRRFKTGQPVDLFWWDSTNAATTGEDLVWVNWITPGTATRPLLVSHEDALKDTLELVNVTGVDCSVTIAAGDRLFLVPHKALMGLFPSANLLTLAADTTYTSNMPTGVEGVLKSSGNLFGSGIGASASAKTSPISLTRHPEFKSYNISVGGSLDEATLMRIAARLTHARGIQAAPDTFYCSEGVFADYTLNLEGSYTYERNGRPVDLEQGFTGVGLRFQAYGKIYTLKTDSFIGKGKLYGVVTRGNNWKRYVPPKVPGGAGYPGFEGGIEFVVPALNGGGSIFQGTKQATTAATTDMVEAPFWLLYQIVPDVLPGMVLSDISEDYGALLS